MPGGSSAAIAASSAAIASSAAAQAELAAERARCHGVLDRYDAKTATVVQARDYSHCVYSVHGDGEPLGAAAVVFIKIAIVVCMLSMVAGGIWGWREDGPMMAVCGALVFPVAAGCLFLAVAMAGWGMVFLVS